LAIFLGGAKRIVDDVKSELVLDEVDETRRAIKDFKSEALHSPEQDKSRRKA